MDRKKRRTQKSEDDEQTEVDEDPGDIIATIHVLKNKTQVKKRVVTRRKKVIEEV